MKLKKLAKVLNYARPGLIFWGFVVLSITV